MTLPLVKWDNPDLARITVLQLVKSLDCYRVAYCSGENRAGEKVLVLLPFVRIPRRGLRRYIVSFAKRAGVYAEGLGIFEALEF